MPSTSANQNFFGVGMSHPWFPFFQMQQMGDMSSVAPGGSINGVGDAAPPTGEGNPAQGPARRSMVRGGKPGQQSVPDFFNNAQQGQGRPSNAQGFFGQFQNGLNGGGLGQPGTPFAPVAGKSVDDLNQTLSGWLDANFYKQPNAYGGPLTTQPGQFDTNAFNAFMTSMNGLNFANQGGQGLMQGMGMASGIPGQVMPSWQLGQNAAMGVGGSANPFLNSGFDFASALAQNGGAPDITKALGDIQTRGMQNIDQQLAQLKEQYGGQGLGRSTDVLQALGRGASTGIADINAQQSSLAAQVMNAAADRRLGAVGQLGQLGNLALGQSSAGANALMNSSGQLLQTYSNPLAMFGQFAGQLGGIGSAYGSIAQGAGSGLAGMGQMDMQRQTMNNQNMYNEFLRMQQPQFLNAALNFGAQQGQQQGFPWGQTMGQLGSAALGILPYFL